MGHWNIPSIPGECLDICTHTGHFNFFSNIDVTMPILLRLKYHLPWQGKVGWDISNLLEVSSKH